MSSPEALAAVTETLQYLMRSAAEQENITAKPPSVARNGESGEQLNIFLYSVHYNPAFRNESMPGKARNGEPAFPPMPLILKYLITAYGEEDKDIEGQKVMGRAMSILHDHPVLSRAELESIESNAGLHQQFERIRITPDTLSLDDMSKLWSSFQSAEYRLSVGYEVSVVLIESSRVARAPAPVLQRGEKDQGVHALPGSLPSLSGIHFLNEETNVVFEKPGAESGDILVLSGEHLQAEDITVQFRHPLLKEPIIRFPRRRKGVDGLTVPLEPDKNGTIEKWTGPAGFYTLSLLIEHDNAPKLSSNHLAMPLAPNIKEIDLVDVVTTGDLRRVVLKIKCEPEIRKEQDVVLILKDRIIAPDSIADPSSTASNSLTELIFIIENVRPGIYVLRLRVDGVDSVSIVFPENKPPEFDTKQQVTIP
jgi:hypothetical protein